MNIYQKAKIKRQYNQLFEAWRAGRFRENPKLIELGWRSEDILYCSNDLKDCKIIKSEEEREVFVNILLN